MKKYAIVLICLIIVLVVAVSIWIRSNSSNVRKTEPTKDVIGTRYTPADMPVSFFIPKTYTPEVKNHLVILKNENSNGDILVHRIASNFDDADSYLDYLAEMNKMKIVGREKIRIHGLDFLLVQYMDMQVKKRIYITVHDGWAYTIESTTPVLNDDLDAVAQSLEFGQ